MIVAFVAWRVYGALHAAPPTQVAVVIDASNSMQANCAEVVAAIQGPMDSHGVRPGSTVTIIRTGDASTRLEPQLIFNEAIPIAAGTGPFGDEKKARQKRAEFLERAEAACAGIEPTKTSPVIKAVRRAVQQLKALGCPREAGCILIVYSDLQDTDELSGRRVDAQPRVIDNAGINVMLCGVTRTVEDGYGVETDDLLETWRALFTEPVRLAPFCSYQMSGLREGGTNR
jgi:hypothetical protein